MLHFFRIAKGVSEERLASLNGVSLQTIRRWERGTPLAADRLIEVLAWIGVPPEAVETALLAHRLGSSPPEPGVLAAPSGEMRRLVHRAAAAGGRSGAEAARGELTRLCSLQEAPRDRSWAAKVLARLNKVPKEKQPLLVEAAAHDDRGWAVAECLCLASETMAAHRADESLRLARLGLGIAEQSRLADRSRWRLAGWCEPFVGNALRVGGDLKAADAAFARGDELWKQGEGGDPSSILDGTRRLDLKASLRMYQEGKTAEALALIDQALQATRQDQVRARLLLKKSRALELDGQYKEAVEVLRQTKPLLNRDRDKRLSLILQFNHAVLYCHLDQYQEAESLLPMIEALADDLRTELDKVRLTWLKGRTKAGLGCRAEAIANLSEVRVHFEQEKIPYDFAEVSLELAVLHLEQGRTERVRKLADDMLWIFRDQRVHQHALAAISLFCQSARLDAADAEWTRRLVKYLYRAQFSPTMRFEG